MTGVPLRDGPLPPWADRAVAGVVVLLAVFFTWLLAQVPPDRRGHGTHERLGMEPCGWPEVYDMPCPTCGVTTAATHLVHGAPIDAVVTQPFGAVLAGTGLFLGALALWSLLRGSSFLAVFLGLRYARLLIGGLLLLLGSWGYKILVW